MIRRPQPQALLCLWGEPPQSKVITTTADQSQSAPRGRKRGSELISQPDFMDTYYATLAPPPSEVLKSPLRLSKPEMTLCLCPRAFSNRGQVSVHKLSLWGCNYQFIGSASSQSTILKKQLWTGVKGRSLDIQTSISGYAETNQHSWFALLNTSEPGINKCLCQKVSC